MVIYIKDLMKNYILLFISVSFLINLNAHSSPHDNSDYNQCNWEKHTKTIDNIFSNVKDNMISTSPEELFSNSLQKSEIVIIGESHIETLPKNLIANNIDLLIKNNFKFIAIEMINKTSQTELTQFAKEE